MQPSLDRTKPDVVIVDSNTTVRQLSCRLLEQAGLVVIPLDDLEGLKGVKGRLGDPPLILINLSRDPSKVIELATYLPPLLRTPRNIVITTVTPALIESFCPADKPRFFAKLLERPYSPLALVDLVSHYFPDAEFALDEPDEDEESEEESPDWTELGERLLRSGQRKQRGSRSGSNSRSRPNGSNSSVSKSQPEILREEDLIEFDPSSDLDSPNNRETHDVYVDQTVVMPEDGFPGMEKYLFEARTSVEDNEEPLQLSADDVQVIEEDPPTPARAVARVHIDIDPIDISDEVSGEFRVSIKHSEERDGIDSIEVLLDDDMPELAEEIELVMGDIELIEEPPHPSEVRTHDALPYRAERALADEVESWEEDEDEGDLLIARGDSAGPLRGSMPGSVRSPSAEEPEDFDDDLQDLGEDLEEDDGEDDEELDGEDEDELDEDDQDQDDEEDDLDEDDEDQDDEDDEEDDLDEDDEDYGVEVEDDGDFVRSDEIEELPAEFVLAVEDSVVTATPAAVSEEPVEDAPPPPAPSIPAHVMQAQLVTGQTRIWPLIDILRHTSRRGVRTAVEVQEGERKFCIIVNGDMLLWAEPSPADGFTDLASFLVNAGIVEASQMRTLLASPDADDLPLLELLSKNGVVEQEDLFDTLHWQITQYLWNACTLLDAAFSLHLELPPPIEKLLETRPLVQIQLDSALYEFYRRFPECLPHLATPAGARFVANSTIPFSFGSPLPEEQWILDTLAEPRTVDGLLEFAADSNFDVDLMMRILTRLREFGMVLNLPW